MKNITKKMNAAHEKKSAKASVFAPGFRLSHLCVAFSLLGFSAYASALVTVDDDELSTVTAQDGITTTVTTPDAGITAQSINATFYGLNGATTATGGEGTTSLSGLSLKSVDSTGAIASAPVTLTTSLDTGTNAAGKPYIGMDMNLSPAQFRINNLYVASGATIPTSATSMGSIAIDGSA